MAGQTPYLFVRQHLTHELRETRPIVDRRPDGGPTDILWMISADQNRKLVMGASEAHPLERTDGQLLAECALRQQRRSGPGGQHRNKVATGVFLTHVSTGVQASATERRSQAENRRVALERLRIQLAVQVRLVRGTEEVPSSLWRSRLRGRQIQVSRQHRDFANLLAEGLDVLQDSEWSVATASQRLACSSSQLTGLLRKEPLAWVLVNARRVEAGLAPLR